MESTFGLRLRVARDAANLTQLQVASALGVASTTIARYEQDADVPRTERARELARILGVSSSWLVLAEGFGPAIVTDPRERRAKSQPAA